MAPLLWSSYKIRTLAGYQNRLSDLLGCVVVIHLKVQPRSSDAPPEHGWEVLERGVGGGDAQHGRGRHR